jgi:hypothetical protein
MMRCHNLLHNIEPEPRATGFCGIQWLKDMGQVLRWDTDAGIADLQLYLRCAPPATQGERPPLKAGVNGILHKMQQGASKGISMESHCAELCQPLHVEVDAAPGERAGHFLSYGHYLGANVRRFPLDRRYRASER